MTTPVAGSTSQPGDQGGYPAPSGEFVAYDQFIDNQLHTARRQVRTVDIAVSLTTLFAGTLGFFLLAALCDHWLLSRGLGRLGRWLALVVYLAGALTYIWHSLLPLCIRRINPVYAAYAIERSKPTLKNSLINFLLLRTNPAGLAPHVYEAIEQRAATELAQVPVEATIDRSKLIKIGYVFLGLLLLAAIYKVSSPKDPFRTACRIVLPWADIAPPTRVTIVEVRPGDSTLMRGQRAKISAQIQGALDQESVKLLYSTDDGQVVDRAMPMQLPSDGYLFECELPEGKGGIQQDVTYRVVAGDATSKEFRLTVQAAPTIVVESVDYVYPPYTGMVSQTVDHQGDLKAIEGTQITLHALANQPIKSAAIDFDANGTDDQRMTVDDRHATATITLALKADRQTPEHSSYQLHFTTADGNENLQPIRHQIEVAQDVAPEIQFLAPQRDEIELPLNSNLVCEVAAHDPDFALARVSLVGRLPTGPPLERPLLDAASKAGEPWQGQFHKKLTLDPRKLGLKVGDVLEYWAWAEDNKTPAANHTETSHRLARIVSPTKSDTSPDALARGDEQPEDDSDGNRSPDGKQSGKRSDVADGEDQPNADERTKPGGADSAPNPQRDRAQTPNSVAQNDQQPDKADAMQDRADGGRDRDKPNQDPGKDEQGDGDGAKQESSGKQQPGKEPSNQEESGKNQSGKDQSGGESSAKDQAGQSGGEKGQSGKKSAGGEGSGEGESGSSSSNGDSQGGKSAGRGKQGSAGSRGGKRQSVAKDGTEDGEAFDEIIQRQGEQEPADAASGAQHTKTPRGGNPPASGATNKQAGEQAPAEKQTGEQDAAAQQSGEHSAGDKGPQGQEPGNKESREKEPGKQTPGDKEKAGKGDSSAGGEEKDGVSQQPDGENGQQGNPLTEKKGQPDRSDGKMSAGDNPSDGGKNGADKNRAPDGKSANQSKSGEENKPADGDGKSDSGDPGQAGSDPSKSDPSKSDEANPGQSGAGKPSSDKQMAGKQNDKQSADGQPAGKQAGEKHITDKPAPGQSPGETVADDMSVPQSGGNQGKDRDADLEKDPNQAAQSDSPQGGRGSPPPGQSGQKGSSKPGADSQPEPKADTAQEDQGDSGAGQRSANDQQGSPKPQGGNRPGKKSPGKGDQQDGDREKSESAPSPSKSDHQSSSEGATDGDRSGGGKRGEGQKSQQPGRGGPGSHSEADQGGQTAPDPGGEESSDQPGADRRSDKPTSQKGKTPGPGKTTGTQPGTRAGNRSESPNSEGPGSDKPTGDVGAGKKPSEKGSKPGLGGGGGNVDDSEPAEPPAVAAEQADEANLDFTRKATELTIQRLRDQLAKGQVDQELLDRLQWSQQDMERWVHRWEEMFRRSEQQGKEGQAARAELDATLRSLGLRPRAAVVTGHRQDDAAHGMKEGRRTLPPAEYRDQVRQYMQGVSRTQNGPPAPRKAAGADKGSGK